MLSNSRRGGQRMGFRLSQVGLARRERLREGPRGSTKVEDGGRRGSRQALDGGARGSCGWFADWQRAEMCVGSVRSLCAFVVDSCGPASDSLPKPLPAPCSQAFSLYRIPSFVCPLSCAGATSWQQQHVANPVVGWSGLLPVPVPMQSQSLSLSLSRAVLLSRSLALAMESSVAARRDGFAQNVGGGGEAARGSDLTQLPLKGGGGCVSGCVEGCGCWCLGCFGCVWVGKSMGSGSSKTGGDGTLGREPGPGSESEVKENFCGPLLGSEGQQALLQACSQAPRQACQACRACAQGRTGCGHTARTGRIGVRGRVERGLNFKRRAGVPGDSATSSNSTLHHAHGLDKQHTASLGQPSRADHVIHCAASPPNRTSVLSRLSPTA